MNDDRCTFTMTGGSISNNTVTSGEGGGVYVGVYHFNYSKYGSSFTMTGGTISGNSANSGGGVYISSIKYSGYYSTSSFTMTGGTISGNTATSSAGGVFLNGSGTAFTMTGGSVTGNTAESMVGGIYVTANTQMNIGGLVTIDGNMTTGVVENVKLAVGRYLNIIEPLNAASSIGVTTVTPPAANRHVQITSDLNGADTSVFFSDNEDYFVEGKEDGEAYLFVQTPYTISVATPINGTLSADMNKARINKIVTLTVTPDPTYRVDHVYYKPGGENEQEIIPVDGVYSFRMPEGGSPIRCSCEEYLSSPGYWYVRFTMPAADVTVTPVFYPWYHEVRLLFDGTAVHPVISLNGESHEGSFTAYTGDTIEPEIEPYNGYYVDGVTVNGEELLPEGGIYSLTITDESECIFEIQIFHVDHKHTWGEWEALTAATCTEAAVETRSCTVDGCGAAQTRTVGEPLGHDYVGVVTKEPTATEEGIMTYTCSRCGVSYMLYIPKLQVVYPTYLDGADDLVKSNYVAWAAKYGADTESAYETAFLLNIDPAMSIPAGAALLKVVRFDLTAAGYRLELASDMCGLFQPVGRSGTSSLCNGILVVELADDLGAFATSISLPVTIDASGHAVIDFDFGDVALPSALFLRPAIAVKGIVKD